MRPLPFILLLAGLLTGCQQGPRSIYYWGNYEGAIYRAYAKPDNASTSGEIAQLEEDVARATAAHMTPNPGLHAQLGFLYYQQGRLDLARTEFATEKELFPESAGFVDRILSQLKQP